MKAIQQVPQMCGASTDISVRSRCFPYGLHRDERTAAVESSFVPLFAKMYRLHENRTLRGKVIRLLSEVFGPYQFSAADEDKCRQWMVWLNPRTSFCDRFEIKMLIAPQDFQLQRLSGVDLAGTFGLAFRLD